MDENKTMSIAVLGVVAVIAVVSVVLLLTNSAPTGLNVGVGDKVYGGAARGNSYPCRLVDGTVGTCQEEVFETQVPFRTSNRVSIMRPSWQTSCGPGYESVSFDETEKYVKYGGKNPCFKQNGDPDGRYCCPLRNLAKGEVID